ncbi:choice-of-anchor M domain-containing protein [Streptomyces sp. DSM 44915]|uniref:Choice-of-anchor M domain-containing protein n=1 Tax=Streptomyces chisholmiae TaxID=3075540 RepID=A0ABU2JVN2_9ACTN|nr:choice-of-anchor M domain-containing protein [Streptomyces sp. DSM 44915]MDT0269027.1 choice-of-anchor M domain-containing protein [Streptomyces sp. DSM 44915]
MTTRIRPSWRPALAGLTASALVLAGAVGTARAADPLVLDHGHIDAFNVTVEGGELVLDLSEDVTGSHVRHAPEDVLLRVREAAWIDAIPEQYPGSPAGYVLPLTQNPELIWPGWDTNGTAGSGYTDVEIDITAVDGPGDVFLYTLSGFGTVTPLLTDGGYQLPGTLREESPAHTHAQWTFSDPGSYTLDVQATATNPATGDTLTSDPATYTIEVGDPEEPAPEPTGLTVEGLADHYHTGDQVELTAVPDVATELDHYHWYSRDSAAAEWEAAPGGDGDRYVGTAEVDGQQLRAELLDEDHLVVASSAPVTVRINDHGGEEPGGPGGDSGGTGGDDGEEPGDQTGGSTTGGGTTFGTTTGDGTTGGSSGGGSADDASNGTGGTGGSTGTSGGGDTEPQCFPVEEEREVPVEPTEALVLDHGHIDAFNVLTEGEDLLLNLKEDVTGSHVTHAPEDVVLHVKQEAFTESIPDGYPGAPAGYLLPLTQDPELIWPGWDTNGTAGSGYTDVEIAITTVDGPGEVFLYTTNTFGGAVPLLEEGDFALPGTVREASPAHTHAQWTFTEPGGYTLDVRATATNPATGDTLTSDPATYTFAVGDTPDQLSTQGGTTTRTVTVGRTADGADCALPDDSSGGADGAGGPLASTGSGVPPFLMAGVSATLLAAGTAAFLLARRQRAARA